MNVDALLSALEKDEGFVAYVYDDANGKPIVPGYTLVGHPTIWYGLCLEQGRIPQLPTSLPRDLLRYVAQGKWLELSMKAPWVDTLPESTQLGLAMMCYQLGVSGVLGFKKMITALQAGDFETAEAEALDSDWGRKHKTRAKRVARLIRGG